MWFLLVPLSLVYSFGVRIRNFCYRAGWLPVDALPRPVISVGNLTVGGTGKTPATLWLAEELARRGYRVAILSRGYHRTASTAVVLECPELCSRPPWRAEKVGDEPAMMAQLHGQRVGVARKRVEAGQLLLQQGRLDIFILDDGFQHRQLRRDLDLVVLGREWEGWLMPAGPFREPRSAVGRAHLYLITGARERWSVFLDRQAPGARWFFGTLEPRCLLAWRGGEWVELPVNLLSQARVLAVCAIAQPERFYGMLRENKAQVVGMLEFPDHHRYSLKDWQRICRAAQDADWIVTTEKDLVKLWEFPAAEKMTLALRVGMVVDEAEDLVGMVERTVQERCVAG